MFGYQFCSNSLYVFNSKMFNPSQFHALRALLVNFVISWQTNFVDSFRRPEFSLPRMLCLILIVLFKMFLLMKNKCGIIWLLMTQSVISRESTAILIQFSNRFHLNEPPLYMRVESLFKSKIQVRTDLAAILINILLRFFFWRFIQQSCFKPVKKTRLHTQYTYTI